MRNGWRQGALQKALGGRYHWLQGFGNMIFKSGGPPLLSDPGPALAHLERLLEGGQPLLLLCACRNPQTCHRADVAELVRETLGIEAVELEPPAAEAAQQRLF